MLNVISLAFPMIEDAKQMEEAAFEGKTGTIVDALRLMTTLVTEQ